MHILKLRQVLDSRGKVLAADLVMAKCCRGNPAGQDYWKPFTRVFSQTVDARKRERVIGADDQCFESLTIGCKYSVAYVCFSEAEIVRAQVFIGVS